MVRNARPGRRLGRARACARLGDCRLAPGRPALLRAGQCRDRRGGGMRADSRDRHRGACRVLPAGTRSISSSSARRRRWSPGWSTRSKPPGIAAFGPSAAAAALEGSKAFMKDLCARAGIPTAAYRRFRDAGGGQGLYRRARRADRGQGRRARRRQGRHRRRRPRRGPPRRSTRRWASAGSAPPAPRSSSRISSMARRRAFSRWSTARTHCRSPRRRTTSGSATATPGPNTGGMGAYSPAPALTPAFEGQVMERIILPTVRGDGARRAAVQGRPLCRADADRGGARSCSNTMSGSATRNASR